MVVGHLCLVWRNGYFSNLPVFQLGCLVFGFLLWLSWMSYLYVLVSNPLSVASFGNNFCHSIDCLFILFMVSFVVQKRVSLIRSCLSIFA